MGVIHKLHPDVIEFILSQKKTDVSLGCRQLADMVQGQLNIKVSKSSVNNILKSMDLSDSVGRKRSRSQSSSLKKTSASSAKDGFEIPPSAKQKLLKSWEKIDQFTKNPVPPASLEKTEKAEDVSSVQKSVVLEKSFSLSHKASFANVHDSFRKNISTQRLNLPGAGLVFLKAAQWATTPPHFWSDIFEKSAETPEGDISRWNAECFLYAIGGRGMAMEDFQDHAVCVLNDCKKNVGGVMCGASAPLTADAVLVYQRNVQMLSMETHCVQVNDNNGGSFLVDPQMISIWSSKEQCSYFKLPLFQTIGMISRRWISQQQPMIFFSTPEDENVSSVLKLHDACEKRLGCEFASVSLLDHKDHLLFESPSLPEYRRTYLMGLWPWSEQFVFWATQDGNDKSREQNQFSRMFHERNTSEEKAGYHGLSFMERAVVKDFEIRVTDSKDGFERKQRAVFVLNDNRILWGVLTNDFEVSAQIILEKFLERWPNGDHFLFKEIKRPGKEICEKGGAEAGESIVMEKNDSKKAEDLILGHFSGLLLELVRKTCLSRFPNMVSKEVFLKEFVKASGYLESSEKYLRVILQKPGYSIKEAMVRVVAGLNEMDLTDETGRSIRLSVD